MVNCRSWTAAYPLIACHYQLPVIKVALRRMIIPIII